MVSTIVPDVLLLHASMQSYAELQDIIDRYGEDDLFMAADRDGDDQTEIGANLVYAAIHQFGGAEVDRNIPARPFLGISSDNEDDLLAIMDSWADQQPGMG